MNKTFKKFQKTVYVCEAIDEDGFVAARYYTDFKDRDSAKNMCAAIMDDGINDDDPYPAARFGLVTRYGRRNVDDRFEEYWDRDVDKGDWHEVRIDNRGKTHLVADVDGEMVRKPDEDDPRDRPWEFSDKRVGWAVFARKHLVGCTIVGIRYMDVDETEESHWYSSPVVFEMKRPNGDIFFMFPMSDDEGNNGGAMATTLPEIFTLPVI